MLPMLREQRRELIQGEVMSLEFAGIERRLDRLNECLQK
jgi:hypothetical protein